MSEQRLNGEASAALVTGGGRRIGLAIACRLARAGYAVAIHCSPSSLAEAEREAEKIIRDGGRACALGADLSDAAGVEQLIARAGAAFGALSLLVNNASTFEMDSPADFTLDQWERNFAVNLRAPCVLARRFAEAAPRGANASIVNIIDQRVLRLTPQFFSYTLSKAALWTATQTMAQGFAPLGVRVNAVGPGPSLANSIQGGAGFLREVAGLPLEGPIEPDEIAEAVLYLARARHVTGQMIAVDAGQHLSWATPDIVL
ncbi:SDR family oxidoreductase [Methylocella silvestris]|uniref:Short chain dehydrogenase n=1 Tax=Methylocella silvestris TaxID=199596 RepID=A0A2J7TFK6_METSI|nr:SDR family oxidoreductase [Methylocella silvestris]PNG25555.1 short chain dehydrogenase [Methylocella silvestris]